MIALADHDLVRLCRDPRYAERFPRSPAERASRTRKIGITLRRPGNATPLVTVRRSLRKPDCHQYGRMLFVLLNASRSWRASATAARAVPALVSADRDSPALTGKSVLAFSE